MNGSIKLLQVKGIDIKIHWSFFLILVWAAFRWSGSTGQGMQGALFGVAATLMLFGAVTLHELGHSFQALKYNVRVRDIILTPMGGLARMEEMPKKPAQELWIALAGPLVNFGIATLLIGLGWLLQTRSLLTLNELLASLGQVSWSGMLAYLTMANLALGLFNLIPAYPMDGGRVLRAALAMRMEYSRATQIAAQIGQGLALLLGLWGLFSGSYSLVLIALFVWMGARQENKGAEMERGLRDVKVNDAMTRTPQRLNANEPLSKAVELTLTTAQSDFPVVEWGTNQVVGMLGEADLLKGLKQQGEQAAVREIMRASLITVHPDEPLHTALEQMAKNRMRAVPVTDRENNLVGLLTSQDVNEAYRLLSHSLNLATARN